MSCGCRAGVIPHPGQRRQPVISVARVVDKPCSTRSSGGANLRVPLTAPPDTHQQVGAGASKNARPDHLPTSSGDR